MKINSLLNISSKNNQRILDKNFRFFVQNSSDVFVKNSPISFGGKEEYISSDDNIEINEEYIRKLEEGIEEKQHATVINIGDEEFLRINVQEVLKKAKEAPYKAKLNAREELEVIYEEDKDSYTITKTETLNPKNQSITRARWIEQGLMQYIDKVLDTRDSFIKQGKKKEVGLLGEMTVESLTGIFEKSFKDKTEEEINSDKDMAFIRYLDEINAFLNRKGIKKAGELIKLAEEANPIYFKNRKPDEDDDDGLYRRNLMFYMETAKNGEVGNKTIEGFMEMFILRFYRNLENPEQYAKEKSEFINILKDYKIKDADEFFEKFWDLAENFNDFETIYDADEAMEFLVENKVSGELYNHLLNECERTGENLFEAIEKRNYKGKQEELEKILKNLGEKEDPERFYANYLSIIDSLWESNGETLEGSEDIIQICLNFRKTDLFANKKGLITDSKELNEITRRIDFIQKTNLTANEYKALRAGFEKEENFSERLENFAISIETLEENYPISKESAKEHYLQFRDSYNIFTKDIDEEKIEETIIEVYNFVQNFGFKSENDIKKLWNDLGLGLNKSSKSYSSKEMKETLAKANIYNIDDAKKLIKANNNNKGLIAGHLKKYSDLFVEIEKTLPKIEDEEVQNFFKEKSTLEILNSLSDVIFAMKSDNRKITTKEILTNIAKEEIYNFEDYQNYVENKRVFNKNENLKNVLSQVIRETKDEKIKKHFKQSDATTLALKYGFLIDKSKELNSKVVETYLRFAINFNIQNENDYNNFANKYFAQNKDKNLALDLEKIGVISLESLEIAKKMHPDSKGFFQFLKNKNLKELNLAIEDVKKDNPNFAKHLEDSKLDTPIKVLKNYDEIFKYFSKNAEYGDYKTCLSFIQKNRILSVEDFKEKTKDFAQHLDSTEDVLNFTVTTEYDLNKKENKEFYLATLRALKDEESSVKTLENIKIFSEQFLKKSKNTRYPRKCAYQHLKNSFGSLEEFIKFIFDNQIPDIKTLNEYISKFSNPKISTREVSEHFKTLATNKGIDFPTYQKSLDTIYNSIQRLKNELGLDISTSTLNVTKLNSNNFKDRYTRSELFEILEKLLELQENESILNKIVRPYTNYYSITNKLALTKDILENMQEGHDSHSNIIRELGLKQNFEQFSTDRISKEQLQNLSEMIPDEVLDFVNNYSIMNKIFKKQGQVPKISPHARLRILDRVLLENGVGIDELNSEKSRKLLKEFLSKVYMESPTSIEPASDGNEQKRILTRFQFKDNNWIAIFRTDGTLITVVNKDK